MVWLVQGLVLAALALDILEVERELNLFRAERKDEALSPSGAAAAGVNSFSFLSRSDS